MRTMFQQTVCGSQFRARLGLRDAKEPPVDPTDGPPPIQSVNGTTNSTDGTTKDDTTQVVTEKTEVDFNDQNDSPAPFSGVVDFFSEILSAKLWPYMAIAVYVLSDPSVQSVSHNVLFNQVLCYGGDE